MDYATLASPEIVQKVMAALEARKMHAVLVNTKAEALAKIQEMIPSGAEVMTASSTTLQEIGFVDLLKSKNHPWNNLKDAIVAETDPAKQTELRKKSLSADYFLGSVHAITESGQVLDASASGSQIPGYAFSSNNVIWVVGTQKIVPTLEDALTRIRTYVFPLEDARMKSVSGYGSAINKILISEGELMPNRKVTLIFVNEKLGF